MAKEEKVSNASNNNATNAYSMSTNTGWAKKVIPLVHYITLYERYHFFGQPCTIKYNVCIMQYTQQIINFLKYQRIVEVQ